MKVGIVGMGFMGATHAAAFSKMDGVEVAAIVRRHGRPEGSEVTRKGNLDRPAEPLDLSAAREFQDWKAMVKDGELDAVDICLPTNLHAEVTLAALAAGKHVFCEKPMALSVEECERMLVGAQEAKRVLMIGQVLRFWPEYVYLRQFVQGGEYGRVRSATFVRSCGLPDWSSWLPDEARSGGAVLDLLVHDIDQALLLFGLPERVVAKSFGGPDTAMASLLYRSGPEVRIQGGWLTPGTPLQMGFQVRAERAELELNADGLFLSDAGGNRRAVSASGDDGYEAEMKYFAECCTRNKAPELCRPEDSLRAVSVALLLKESRAAGGVQKQCLV
jgi:predicted dehydrogenase